MGTDSALLSRLTRSLALLDADQAIARQGLRVILYCDTFDVVTALQGVVGFVHVEHGKEALRTDTDSHQALFDQPRALVACLLASEWLGPFRLLPSHGAEFSRLIDDGRLFPTEGRRNLLIDHFLEMVGFSDGAKNGSRSVTQLDSDEMYSLVKRYAGEADRAFKAVQSILYSPQERLVQWHERNLLRSTKIEFDYLRLTRSRGFVDLLSAFSNSRGWGPNDYSDSVALVMLRELSRRAESGSVPEVPRFFDPTGIFGRMAREAGIENDLWTRLPGGIRTPILIDSDYLIQKASFLPFQGAKNIESTAAVDPADILIRLQQITKEEGSEVGAEETATIRFDQHIGGIPLTIILSDLGNCAFLKNIWLKELAREELRGFADRFDKILVESEAFQTRLDEVILNLRSNLEDKAASFTQIHEAWNVLRDGLSHLRKKRREHGRNQELEFEPIRDLELVRFGLPLSVSADVSAIMVKLLDEALDESELVKLRRWSELVERYYTTLRDPEHSLEAVQVTAAVLWTLRKDRLIVQLLEPVAGKTEAISIDLLYAAACFRGAVGRGRLVLTNLEEKLSAFQDQESSVDRVGGYLEKYVNLGIGVGYLLKHLWDHEGYTASWTSQDVDEGHLGVQESEEGNKLLRRAIDSVQFALDNLALIIRSGGFNNSMKMKMLYAVNQKLFYYTLLDPDDPKELTAMATAYFALKDQRFRSREFWLATFDDTLARYHHFRSRQTADLEDRFLQLREALTYSTKASEGAPHDDLITDYCSTLIDELTEVKARLKKSKSGKKSLRTRELVLGKADG